MLGITPSNGRETVLILPLRQKLNWISFFDAGCLEFKDPEKATGNAVRQQVLIKQGIEQTLAKKIVKALKDSKLKVQASIQGDELRVTGKKRDDLQDAIQLVKSLKIEQPLQFVNFRE